jgi:large subunit ribosomal protein L35
MPGLRAKANGALPVGQHTLLFCREILLKDQSIAYDKKLCSIQDRFMPKLKTRKSAAKRFKASGSGKFMRRKAFKSHLLEHKSSDVKRGLRKMTEVHETDCERVQLMMPYA